MKSFAAIYIPQLKQSYCFQESALTEDSLYLEYFGSSRKIFFEKLEKNAFPSFQLNQSHDKSTSSEKYMHWVQTCIDNIQAAKYTKLVAAQYQVEEWDSSSMNWQELFTKLIHQLPDTYVYLFYIDNEIWIGASPELIGILENNTFKTISLAGTKNEDEFTSKEIDEQTIVTQYIESGFNKNYPNYTQLKKVLSYGNIKHLADEFVFQVDGHFDFENAIHAIHPSPALVGYPKEKSIEFIQANEPIQRNIYTGLVSFTAENMKFSFATIRCACISANQIRFYAGAGITKDSSPIEEWKETLGKINVLKNILLSTE